MIIAQGKNKIKLNTKMLTRHGIIAGSTGSGKTVTLQVIVENLSKNSIPVFMADIKGDLSGIAYPGKDTKIKERAKTLKINNFEFESYPVVNWDVYGKSGNIIKTTLSRLGINNISKMLDLTNTQEGVLYQIFKIAKDNSIDIRNTNDLISLINYIVKNADKYEEKYGKISKVSYGTLQRSLIAFEESGNEVLFDVYNNVFDIQNFIKVGANNKGTINILDATKLINSPKVYSTFMLWLLNELFLTLPEVGDIQKPKIVFFFDEAHLLFKNTSKMLEEQIEKLVKLVRSKGVGVFFITQNPADIPESILSQLGNRVQHSMRCFTPKEQKAVRAISQTFRTSFAYNVENIITNLGIGEALVSFLDNNGIPEYVQQANIYPPRSRIGV